MAESIQAQGGPGRSDDQAIREYILAMLKDLGAMANLAGNTRLASDLLTVARLEGPVTESGFGDRKTP